MHHTFETLVVYQFSLEVSQLAHQIAVQLPNQYRFSIIDQTIRAADSIGANIAEGYGRKSVKEKIYFLTVAKGSANELKHWIRVISQRDLIQQQLIKTLNNKLTRQIFLINQYIKYFNTK